MNAQNQRNRHLTDYAPLKESRTSRFNLPVRHPALWRFVLDQLLSAPIRLHRYRVLSALMYEETIRKLDSRGCR